MNALIKFKSIFKSKNQEQTHEERIGYLANELIKELKASGRSIQSNTNSGHGMLPIWVHDLGSENATLEIEDNKYQRIITKPTFTEF